MSPTDYVQYIHDICIVFVVLGLVPLTGAATPPRHHIGDLAKQSRSCSRPLALALEGLKVGRLDIVRL